MAIWWLAGVALADPFQSKLPAEGVNLVRVDVHAGDVRIWPDAEGHVEFRGEKLNWTEQCSAEATRTGEVVSLTVRNAGMALVAPCEVRWSIHVTPEMGLQIRMGQGSLVIPAMRGRTFLNVGNGDIRLEDVGGPLTLTLGNGVVEGAYVGPELKATVGNGGLHVHNLVSPVTASTNVGDIALTWLVVPPGRIRASNRVGSVRIELPPQAQVEIAARAGLGKKRIEFPHTPGAPTRVEVETQVGTVHVTTKAGPQVEDGSLE